MVQDWGGPIGFWVATRHPEWFRAFVIGNTWAWPMRGERSTEWFSKALGSSVLGGLLVRRADVFVNVFMRGGIRRKKPTPAERQMYKRPHPHPPLAGAGAGHAAGDPGRAPAAGRGRAGTGAARRQAGPSSSGVTRTRVQGAPPSAMGAHLPQPPDPHPPRGLALHPGRRARGDRRRDQSLVARPGLGRIANRCRLRHHGRGQLTAAEVTCPLPPAAHHPGRLPWRRAQADALARRPADRRAPPPPGPLSHQRTTRLAAHPCVL